MKTTEAGGPRGHDTGRKIKGRKRHIVTDTFGNMLEGTCMVPMFRTATGLRS